MSWLATEYLAQAFYLLANHEQPEHTTLSGSTSTTSARSTATYMPKPSPLMAMPTRKPLKLLAMALQRNAEVTRVSKLLRDFGFMGDASGRALLKASNTTITIPIPKLGNLYKRESTPRLNIYNLIPYIESWVCEATADVRHVLLIDGLDSIYLNDAKYDESLSSLVQAAYAVNQKLREHSATGSVVLLLRNDVFSRISLSLPDSQKMRDDLSFDLDWRVLSGPSGVRAPLMKLVNTKAAQVLGVESIDVLSYFPAQIGVGGRGKTPRTFPTFQYLLNMTRHTPRDLLRLFEEIRKVDASGLYGQSEDMLNPETIHEDVLQYASKYFVGAISNEFAGYQGGPESALSAMAALRAIGKQTFNAEEFRLALDGLETPAGSEATQLLKLLFYAGAIGNYVAGRGESYMQFYHRRDDSDIYLKGSFVLHHALIHAWGMRRTKSAPPATLPGGGAKSGGRPSPRVRRRTRGGAGSS